MGNRAKRKARKVVSFPPHQQAAMKAGHDLVTCLLRRNEEALDVRFKAIVD
jgi:hypothetical protein